MLRELDGDPHRQCMFLTFLGILVFCVLSLRDVTIRARAKVEDKEVGTNPDTETCTVLTLQSANLGKLQCGLLPDLGVDSNFNFVRLQRIGIILIELDSTEGEGTVRVEEERAIRERKLETGIGGVFWTTMAARSVWMTGLVGVIRFAGMVWLVRMVGFARVVWSVRMVGTMRMVRSVRRARFVRMAGLVGVVGLVGVMRRMRTTGAVGTRMFDLLRFRPMSMLVTF